MRHRSRRFRPDATFVLAEGRDVALPGVTDEQFAVSWAAAVADAQQAARTAAIRIRSRRKGRK